MHEESHNLLRCFVILFNVECAFGEDGTILGSQEFKIEYLKRKGGPPLVLYPPLTYVALVE